MGALVILAELAIPAYSNWTNLIVVGTASCFLLAADDAMDSVFPCVAEEWLRPIMQNKFSNPAKMNFQYASQ